MSQTVLITGCSSGFGLATAQLLSSQSWNVIITMRKPDTTIFPPSENIMVTRLDVEEPHSMTTAITEGIRQFGKMMP